MSLAHRIKEARRQRGFTLRQFAKRSRIAESHLSRLESGEQADPRMSTLIRLADALGITIDELAGRATAAPTVASAGLRDLLEAAMERLA